MDTNLERPLNPFCFWKFSRQRGLLSQKLGRPHSQLGLAGASSFVPLHCALLKTVSNDFDFYDK